MHTLNIDLPQKNYSIIIKKGLLNNIGEEIKKAYTNEKIAIITDLNVGKLYKEKIKNQLKNDYKIKIIEVTPGEKSKSINVLQKIYDELLDFKITRKDLILCLGGGIVGDLGGFAASTFLRGIPFIQIPTSLLAQIDSSIGGKVAVNLPKGKNLIGSFYHPEKVLIDPNVLKTLDKRFFYDGMAEVIKYGCIKDKKLFDNLLKYDTNEFFNHIEEIIYKCCSIKKSVVEKDEKDTGERMILNFGHTLGHAIEKYYHYEKYTHGEAVAIGMYHLTKKSEDMKITEKGTTNLIEEILYKYNLSYKMPDINKKDIIETISLDKKNIKDRLNIILLKKIGDSFIKEIKKDDITQYI